MICIFVITAICVSVIATQPYFQEVDNDVSEICANSSHTKSFILSALNTLVHPGGILIMTDCSLELFMEDIRVFSYASFAIVSETDIIQPKIFGESKPFIVIDLPYEKAEYVTMQIYRTFQEPKIRIKKWQPTIVVIWKEKKEPSMERILFQQTFKDTYLDSNIFIILTSTEIPYKISAWEIYSVKEKKIFAFVSSTVLTDSGRCSESLLFCFGKELITLENIAKRRRDFQREKFTTSVKYDPYYKDWVDLTKKEDGTFTFSSGYAAILFWDLQMLMNFSESIIIGDTPMAQSNGTLVGITVQQLYSGEADITLNQISVSISRAKAFTFLQPTYYSLVHAFFKQPATRSLRDIVTAAFQRELWIALIGMWAVLVISVQVRRILLPKSIFSPYPRWHFTFFRDSRFAEESVLWSVAAFCQKSWYLSPCSNSLRMKFMIGSFVSLMSYTAYSASIVSSLAVNNVPVKTFIDLISFNFIFTVHESSEPYQTMLHGMIESYNLDQDVVTTSTKAELSHLFMSSSSELQSSRKAFLSSADIFYKVAETQNYSERFICDHVSSVPSGSIPLKSGMLVKKGSEYKEILNYMLIYLQGRGMIFRYIQKYNIKNLPHCRDDQRTVVPAVLNDVFTIIIVLLFGVLSALVIFTLEVVYKYHYYRGFTRNKTDYYQSDGVSLYMA